MKSKQDPPKGMIVGAKNFISLPHQQKKLEMTLAKPGQAPGVKEEKQARKILNEQVSNYEIQPSDVFGGKGLDGTHEGGAAFSNLGEAKK